MYSYQLKKHLFEEYGGFADKRIKDINKGRVFICDDRRPDDFAADGNLFLWFCVVTAEVIDGNRIVVELKGGVPLNRSIINWCSQNDAQLSKNQETLHLEITKGNQNTLARLAELIEAITLPGRTFSVPAYKYVCPRTAGTLRRLAATLSRIWSSEETNSLPGGLPIENQTVLPGVQSLE